MKFKRFAPKGPRLQRGFINIGMALEWFGRRPTDIREFFRGGNPGLHLQAITPAQNAVQQTMFQDSAGTMLVTAAEQPVGLWLDTRLGLTAGTEKAVNGDFSSATGWSVPAGGAIGSNVVTLTAASGYLYRTDPIGGIVAGSTYLLTFDVSAYTGGTARGYVNASPVFGGTIAANGRYSCRVTAGSASGEWGINFSGFTGVIDNVSLKLLPGNHAIQSSAGARPTFTQRYNGLIATEDLTSGSWAKSGTCTAPAATTINLPAVNDYVYQAVTAATWAGRTAVNSVVLSGSGTIDIGFYDNVIGNQTSTVTLTATPTRYSKTATIGAGAVDVRFIVGRFGASTATTATVTAMNLYTAADAAKAIPAYQRVTTSTNYDTDGFPGEVKGNGTSQFMSGTMDLSTVDKVLLVCGLKKYSDAAQGVVFELTASAAANNGGLALCAPAGASATFSALSRGTTTRTATTGTTHAAPKSAVMTAQGDISGDSITTRVNGVADGSDTGDQGTGNYASATYYLFARGGASLWSSAGIHSLTIRGGDSSSGSLIGKIENYAKQLARLVY